MAVKLNWNDLLSSERRRQRQTTVDEQAPEIIVRNAFDADYDRIVGSSSVRRLQDKAQVFPLQEDDVARTRLTHSIEVSALACSLGRAVGYQISKKYPEDFNEKQIGELASLLQVCGLIHDLGNPPFGHYGETVIRKWFKNWFQSTPILEARSIVFTEQEKNDFLYFDGNVQNLRIVTKLQVLNDKYGANFTYATLGTIMKYPWSSIKRPLNRKGKQFEKFGYFKAEEDIFDLVRKKLRLSNGVRHPATYLLEAADDIIYLCDDIEDGVKKGLIDWQTEYKKIQNNLRTDCEKNDELKKLFESIDAKTPDNKLAAQEKETAKVRTFRNLTQSYLFKCAIKEFMANYDRIMSNEPIYDFELLQSQTELVNELKRVAQTYCFPSKEVLLLELAGDKVISTLLNLFVPALLENDGNTLSDFRTYPGKLFKMISPNFVYIAMTEGEQEDVQANSLAQQIDRISPYNRLLLATDFISGMTDSYAVNIYKDLMGIRHPII